MYRRNFMYGEYGPRTPTEQRETKGYDQQTEVKIPLQQAAAIALSVAITLTVSPVLAVMAAGDAAFWLFSGIWMFATFLWYLKRSANLVTEDNRPIVEQYDMEVCNVLSWLEVIAGCAMSLMVGGIALCFHKVLVMVEPVEPEWLSIGWTRIVCIGQFPGFVVLSIFLVLSFGQELAQRSPHQELFIWQAIGKLLEGFGTKWVDAWAREPVIIRAPNGPTPGVQVVQRSGGMTPAQKQAAMFREFIERGAEIGFSRRLWVGRGGRDLGALGRKLTDGEYRYLVGVLKDANLMETDNSGTRLTCNAAEAIVRVIAPE